MPNGFERLVYGRDERTRGGSASEETNAAVAAACGWDAETSEDGALKQLLNLNRGWRFPRRQILSVHGTPARNSPGEFAGPWTAGAQASSVLFRVEVVRVRAVLEALVRFVDVPQCGAPEQYLPYPCVVTEAADEVSSLHPVLLGIPSCLRHRVSIADEQQLGFRPALRPV